VNAPAPGFARLACLLVMGVLVAVAPRSARAINANPNPIEITQPDGTRMTVHLIGDERMHWWEDQDGYVIVQEQSEYRYATRGLDGRLHATLFRAGSVAPATLGLTPHLRPSDAARAALTEIQRGPESAAVVTPATGTVLNLVVLAQFSNHGAALTKPASSFAVLFNQIGGDPTIAPTGSVRDVWKENSYNALNLVSTIQNWVTLPSTETWYANADSGFSPGRRDSLVKDALNLLDATVDFSAWDANNDGYVDAIDIIHSGYGSEADGNANRVWSQAWVLSTDWVSNDRNANNVLVKVSRVHTEPALFGAAGSTICRIGVIAHETGHFFGLPDLYDYDYNGAGVGSWCLMGNSWGWDNTQLKPPHLSAWCKTRLGYVTPINVASPGVFSLPQAETNAGAAVIGLGYGLNEYLMIENRQPVGFDSQLKGGGLAIWHIDVNVPTQPGDPCNKIQGYPGQPGWPDNGKHYAIALLQADGRYDLEKSTARGDSTDLYSNQPNIAVSDETLPSGSGYQVGFVVPNGNEISEVSAPGTTMTFRYRPSTWVDFSYTGPHIGSFILPYGDLTSAMNATPDDAIIMCKAGTSYDHPNWTRVMRFKSFGGTTTIGP
jgi:M6 family metalloprotease-like protein